jgi:hypothetical protein
MPTFARNTKAGEKTEETDNKKLRKLLQDGLDSGISSRSPEEIRQGVIQRLKKDGKLQTK